VCQAVFDDASFYQSLFQLDQAIAADVQAAGCQYCGGRLHVADYPRKPRGVRSALDASYQYRLSFCCAADGCRRRTTPPSVRFLGRKVYLGVVIVLVTALTDGLSSHHRRRLIDQLDLWPQTIARWQRWWREQVPMTRCWQALRPRFVPPIEIRALPGALLRRLTGNDLTQRMRQLLTLIAPLTTGSWASSLLGGVDPQKM
jgi:hypothetical protein